MKWICIGILKIYKAVLSPLKAKRCKFTPSCSVFAMEAYYSRGFIVGSILTAKRLFRCSPWHKGGGFDPVPLNIKGEIKWSI